MTTATQTLPPSGKAARFFRDCFAGVDESLKSTMITCIAHPHTDADRALSKKFLELLRADDLPAAAALIQAKALTTLPRTPVLHTPPTDEPSAPPSPMDPPEAISEEQRAAYLALLRDISSHIVKP